MKIYTKSGDKGETSLFGGERVKKNHLSIQAYGTIDELNSWIGLIKDNMGERETNLLISVQEQLFIIGSYLATGNNKKMMINRLDRFFNSKKNYKKIQDKLRNTGQRILNSTYKEIKIIIH